MSFEFEERPSDSSFVDSIWRGFSQRDGVRTAPAGGCWAMLVERRENASHMSIIGPMTRALPMPYSGGAEYVVIKFQLGVFMPYLPARLLVDAETHLPEATCRSIWLNGSTWQAPDYENADTFVERLARDGLLARDPVVDAALEGQMQDISPRTVQRRFARATGLTHSVITQIRRARYAMSLLQQGVPIVDASFEAGYVDQPHLTKSLKHLVGQTPAQIVRSSQVSALSF